MSNNKFIICKSLFIKLNLLEKSKDDPKFLKNLEKKYKESLKRKKAKGKKHYWEDYNLAYINMLLNR